ncbi:conjugal transfer protein TraF [Neobacillus terrae]|uniref:conjugal transfer protein TraF n=1 Tax=Neobacillus terrae TaxID=3034837 RepID=UPI001409C9FD|nr:conjugal transfer protein TraF [Neobacillus terrae]NHM29297.1 conjugal transfer protein TraF [Neobacillus terrae]
MKLKSNESLQAGIGQTGRQCSELIEEINNLEDILDELRKRLNMVEKSVSKQKTDMEDLLSQLAQFK